MPRPNLKRRRVVRRLQRRRARLGAFQSQIAKEDGSHNEEPETEVLFFRGDFVEQLPAQGLQLETAEVP